MENDAGIAIDRVEQYIKDYTNFPSAFSDENYKDIEALQIVLESAKFLHKLYIPKDETCDGSHHISDASFDDEQAQKIGIISKKRYRVKAKHAMISHLAYGALQYSNTLDIALTKSEWAAFDITEENAEFIEVSNCVGGGIQ